MYKGNFIGDKEKMYDFTRLTKEEFMNTYSYLTGEEYDNTECIYQQMLGVLEEVETKLFILSEKNWSRYTNRYSVGFYLQILRRD